MPDTQTASSVTWKWVAGVLSSVVLLIGAGAQGHLYSEQNDIKKKQETAAKEREQLSVGLAEVKRDVGHIRSNQEKMDVRQQRIEDKIDRILQRVR